MSKTSVRRAVASTMPVCVIRDTNSRIRNRTRLKGVEFRDDFLTFDRMTLDSTGAFLLGELERLDQRLHMPLASVTWTRDINLREDVTMADENSSFTNSSFGSPQGIAGSNKAWAGKDASAIVGVSVDIGKTIQPLPIWAIQLSWTLPELASAQKLGRPVDEQKFKGMQLKYQMDVDEEVYIGDSVLQMNGMLNHSAMTNVGNAVTGLWASATPAQILADINSIISSVWAATGWAVMPNRLLVPPNLYTLLRSTLISSAGNISILKFLLENNAAVGLTTEEFKILPSKWLIGTNNGGRGCGAAIATDSMYCYVKDADRIRFPLVPLQRTPIENRDIRQITTYFGRLGGVELVYPETVARRSNLG